MDEDATNRNRFRKIILTGQDVFIVYPNTWRVLWGDYSANNSIWGHLSNWGKGLHFLP